jgi:hypothetical protein
MDELTEWFLGELGHLGFSLTPTMYNPENFAPIKSILYTYPINDQGNRRCVKLRTYVTTDLVQDVVGIGIDMAEDYRDLIVRELQREVEDLGLPIPNFGILKPKDFKPKQKLNKFKL